jgi:hypothetical protein
MSCGQRFSIDALNDQGLKALYRDAVYHGILLGIEAVSNGAHGLIVDENPAELQSGSDGNRYVIYFVNKLSGSERIMALGHELGHLLLLSKYGLKPGPILVMEKGILEIIQTIQNVTHHLILLDLLWEEYRIRSDLHLNLIRGYLREYLASNKLPEVNALRVFEYEKLIGKVEDAISVGTQAEPFQKAYESANARFGKYSFKHIPPSHDYREDIISFLIDIGQIRRGCNT